LKKTNQLLFTDVRDLFKGEGRLVDDAFLEELRRIPATSWYRLQRLVEPAPTAFVVLSRHNLVASARTKIVLENRWTLPDLSRDNPGAQLHFKVRRAKTIASALG